MKIILLTTDTLHHRYFINKLLDSNIRIDKCFFQTDHLVPKFSTSPLYEKEEDLFESSNFFESTRQDLDKVQVEQVPTFNSQESIEQISKSKPDFGVSFGAGIIYVPTINLFKNHLINVHRGIVQEYRGLDSDLWAIYHKDYNNIGVTIHLVEKELDTGDIVGQERLTIKKNMKIWQLRYYTTLIATKLVINAIKAYIDGEMPTFKQQNKGRYYSFMPLDLKKNMVPRFNSYCEKLDG